MVDHNSFRAEPSMRLDARIGRSRASLRSALLSLLETASFDQITIRQISTRAGIGYATYFRHYPDKWALLNDLAADVISELLGRTLPIIFAEDTRAACLALCNFVAERRALWAALLTGGAAGVMHQELLRQARLAVPERAEAQGWLPTDLSVAVGTAGMIEVVTWWLRDHEDMPPERVAEILDRLVISPAVAR
jgi:AcrR family transcriptional regulator